MRKTLKFRLISGADFSTYFRLDSPGYYLVRDALQGEDVSDALDTLEAVCLANKFYEMKFRDRILQELQPHGKSTEYLEKCDTEEGADLAIHTLGRARVAQLIREVMVDVRRTLAADPHV
jgi:hypothetical protein